MNPLNFSVHQQISYYNYNSFNTNKWLKRYKNYTLYNIIILKQHRYDIHCTYINLVVKQIFIA